MNIKVTTNIDIFYKQLLQLFSSFNPIKNLRQAEINVLAEIMKQNYNYRNIKEHVRRNIIFSQETKNEMCENLGISRDSFNNNISILRKKNILNADNTLIKVLNIFPDKEFTFNVTFKLENNE